MATLRLPNDKHIVELRQLLRKDDQESDVYQLKTTSPTLLEGRTVGGGGFRYIQPEGGPTIMEGTNVPDHTKIVASIALTQEFGYIFRLK